ncbi:vacuolar protein sorting-associated protein 33B-like protein, partial [Leptotrombidium deliense]
ITLSEFVLDKKKESEFAEQLEVENNIILGNDLKQCIQHIEEGIIRQFSEYTSLRLLSLLSLTEEGLSSKDYRHFVKLFLQSFGHDHIITLLNMKKMGLLFEQNLTNHILSPVSGGNNLLNTKVVAAMSAFPRKSHFRATIKRLNLIPPVIDSGYNLSNPTDAGFVFGGIYIPMVCRLIETAIINNDKNQDELLKMFPGEYSCKELSKSGHRRKEKTVLVCFIGGVTFAEIAALRFLANKKRITILVTTTSIINGNIAMKQIGPE